MITINEVAVILYQNLDKSFTIALHNVKWDLNVKVFTPAYEGHKCYKYAYEYAYNLSEYLGIDFTEIAQ